MAKMHKDLQQSHNKWLLFLDCHWISFLKTISRYCKTLQLLRSSGSTHILYIHCTCTYMYIVHVHKLTTTCTCTVYPLPTLRLITLYMYTYMYMYMYKCTCTMYMYVLVKTEYMHTIIIIITHVHNTLLYLFVQLLVYISSQWVELSRLDN